MAALPGAVRLAGNFLAPDHVGMGPLFMGLLCFLGGFLVAVISQEK
jgi:hypothetical protein